MVLWGKGLVLKHGIRVVPTQAITPFIIYNPPPLASGMTNVANPSKVWFRGKAEVGREANSANSAENAEFAPPICRMPLGPSQPSPKLIPEAGSAPGFDIA